MYKPSFVGRRDEENRGLTDFCVAITVAEYFSYFGSVIG